MGNPTDEPTSTQISYEQLQTILLRYPSHVREGLHSLDEKRFKAIPAALAKRKTAKTAAHLDKTELEALVEWKLKHGTYRPKLAALVASNSAAEIRDATAQAFKSVDAHGTASPAVMLNETFAALTKLKGIGPATASLILSCYDPVHLPFFSDELFRYVQETLDWRVKIGYTKKEYSLLFTRFAEIQNRLEEESGKKVAAVDLEKVAYVLGKEASGSSLAKPTSKKRAAKEVEAPPAKTTTHTKRRKE